MNARRKEDDEEDIEMEKAALAAAAAAESGNAPAISEATDRLSDAKVAFSMGGFGSAAAFAC